MFFRKGLLLSNVMSLTSPPLMSLLPTCRQTSALLLQMKTVSALPITSAEIMWLLQRGMYGVPIAEWLTSLQA
ncbi:hypothetical protein Barb7_02640 [Bacteroidales bacterium Barb7]|nr:hypothetical protein Barb7_02640 [Bacteroidales bacterium Barb7]